MGLTIILGLAVLSAANYGNTFEFSGLDQSTLSKTQFKPTIKPFPTLTNQATDQTKSVFGFKSAVTSKPFGTSFDTFKSTYQPYQPAAAPFKANYQPFGPYPGYPGPVVYPGHSGYQGPPAYPGFAGYQAPPAFPPPAFRGFNDPNNKPFGFQSFSAAPPQPSFNPFKFGSSKKFNKNSQGLAEVNLPGKYFQEHQFGAYHGPEFSSAIVPAEHSIKQSKPKDTLLGKPAVPNLPEFGFHKQGVYGFASPTIFGFPVPKLPPFQPFVSTVPSTKSASDVTTSAAAADPFSVTTAAPLAQYETATARFGSEENAPSATPVADPQPTSPSQEEATGAGITAAAEVTTDNEVPAAADDTAAVQQSEQSNAAAEATDPSATAGQTPAVAQEAAQEAAKQSFGPVVAEQVTETSTAEAVDATAGKAEGTEEVKPTESVAANLPGLPSEPFATAGALPASDPSSLTGLFSSSGYPYFGESAGSQQPYIPYYNSPKFTEDELKLFTANFAGSGLDVSQIFGGANAPFKIAEPKAPSEESATIAGTPSAENVEKVETSENVASGETGEKKEGDESKTVSAPEAPKKSNTIQIVPDDVFNGQLPLLFDPSNAASPLDAYRFYSHPSVSALSSQATLASYSPEAAFTDFGSQLRQGYLVAGSPSLTPGAKTVVQTSRTPISISSADHPLHSQVFKYSQSQSFVPYAEAVAANAAPVTFRTYEPLPLQLSTQAPSSGAVQTVATEGSGTGGTSTSSSSSSSSSSISAVQTAA